MLPTLIARFGGQMYHFNGDKPVKIEVASPQAIEFVGSMPAPTEYPNKIEGWTEPLSRAFAVETPKIAQSHPTTKILGAQDINAAVAETLQGMMGNQLSLQTGLQQLNTQFNEILLRTNP